jgi:hypothetical protein
MTGKAGPLQPGGDVMKNLPLLAYLVCIIIGAIMIVFPGGIVICIACGPAWMTIVGAVAVIVGIAGIATRSNAMAMG